MAFAGAEPATETSSLEDQVREVIVLDFVFNSILESEYDLATVGFGNLYESTR
jgi:hypothetical protein